MARRHQHEEHVNHEAWAIPYGDLVTLLLAFFVVMYAVSSVNEGKYRVMADAMSSAFGGTPRTIAPVQLGQNQLRGSSFDRPSLQTAAANAAGPTPATPVTSVRVRQMLDMPTFGRQARVQQPAEVAGPRALRESERKREQELTALGEKIQHALAELVRQKLVVVRRGRTFLEIEIQSDILFASGAAEPSALATSTVRKLASVLRDSPNALRVEGYTDNRPIRTPQFPSNWELSTARAASVVHVLTGEGIAARRLAVVGYGEHQPLADNASPEGRNANRRVLMVILAAPQGPDAVPEAEATISVETTPAVQPVPAEIPVLATKTPSPIPAARTSASGVTPPGVTASGMNASRRSSTRSDDTTKPAAPARASTVVSQAATQPGAG